jgi:hypothetical protein
VSIQGQRRCVLPLPNTVIVIAAGLGQRRRRHALHQDGIPHADLQVQPSHQHGVTVKVINNQIACEVVRALNNSESEAIPLQRIGGSQYVVLPFCRRYLPMLNGDELDIGGIADGVPDDVLRIGVLEPTAVGVMPTKVQVEEVRHGPDITPTGDIHGSHD